MFTLVTDRSKYFRVKRGQSACEIESTLKTPTKGCVFTGAIIQVAEANLTVYRAKVGDTYRTVAEKLGIEEGRLKEINGNKLIYPTCKLFVPC